MFNREMLIQFSDQIKSLEIPNLKPEETEELMAIVGVLQNAIFNMRLAHKVSIDIKNSQLESDQQLKFEGDPDISSLIADFKLFNEKYTKAWKDKIIKYSNVLDIILTGVPKALARFKELNCIKDDAPKIILLH